eukprot:jgi/Orpsp1_1/1184627/evm.model.c7180000090300.1
MKNNSNIIKIAIAAAVSLFTLSYVRKMAKINNQKHIIEENKEEIDYLRKIIEDKIENGVNKNRKNENGDYLCSICDEELVRKVLVPCGHYGICNSCINKIKKKLDSKCPFCRKKFSDSINIYHI